MKNKKSVRRKQDWFKTWNTKDEIKFLAYLAEKDKQKLINYNNSKCLRKEWGEINQEKISIFLSELI